MALGRPDLSFTSRVAAGKMSNPLEGDDMLIKRAIRYLKGRPRVAILYQFQEAEPDVVVMTDSDWAGDEITRRSTRGGVALNGTHTPSPGGANPGTYGTVVVRGRAQLVAQRSY